MTILHRAAERRGNLRRSYELKAYWRAVHRIMDRHAIEFDHSALDLAIVRLTKKKGAGKV